ncbi:hypothetical protein Tco_0691926 [Tanacetum coccineum]
METIKKGNEVCSKKIRAYENFQSCIRVYMSRELALVHKLETHFGRENPKSSPPTRAHVGVGVHSDEWQKPLTLDFKTFCESTGLDYNQGNYVVHPSPEAVKAELSKIATNKALVQRTHVLKTSFPVAWRILLTFVVQDLGGNYSSTKQLNSI